MRTIAALSDRCTNASDTLSQVTVANDQIECLIFNNDIALGIFWILGYRDGDLDSSATTPPYPGEHGKRHASITLLIGD